MIKIGETFIYKNMTFIVREETDVCHGCFFDDNLQYNCSDLLNEDIHCCKRRTDDAIFVLYNPFKFGK